jgi:biopolymer transport protein ExbD
MPRSAVSKGGVIVRLIDIVLNLLFGFMSISEIDRRTAVRLSEAREIPVTHVDQQQILVVGIIHANHFVIENKDDDGRGDGIHFYNMNSLLRYIDSQKIFFKQHGQDMKVRIRSNWYLPAKHALDVALYCEHIGVERGLDVRVIGGR